LIGIFFVGGVFYFRKPMEDPLDHTLHMLTSKLSTDRQTAIANLSEFTAQQDRWVGLVVDRLRDEDAEVRRAAVDLLVKLHLRQHLPEIMTLLNDKSDQVRKSVLLAVKTLGERLDGELVVRAALGETDPEMKVAMFASALEVGTPSAVLPLVEVVRGGGIFADEAYHAIRAHVEVEFAKSEIDRFEQWWKSNHHRIIWEPSSRRFIVQVGREKHG
jgi:hypothetical protein